MTAGWCKPWGRPFGPVLILIRLTVYLNQVDSSGRGADVAGGAEMGAGTARDPVEAARVSGSESVSNRIESTRAVARQHRVNRREQVNERAASL